MNISPSLRKFNERYYLSGKYISDNQELGDLSRFLSIILPDRFIEQGSPDKMYKNAGLDAESIADRVQRIFNVKYQNNKNLKA